jgi:hypothetical protein
MMRFRYVNTFFKDVRNYWRNKALGTHNRSENGRGAWVALCTHLTYTDTDGHIMAMPWLRRLVACLSPWGHRFAPMSVRVGYVVDEVTLEQDFSPSSSVFPCQHHSAVALHAHNRLGDEQRARLCPQFRDTDTM